MTVSTRAAVLFAVATLPFALLPAVSAWSVGPLARLGARLCNVAAAGVAAVAVESVESAPNVAPLENDGAASDESDPHPDALPPSSGSAARPRADRAGSAAPGAAVSRRALAVRSARPNVFVGPESIKRAIPTAGRPTSSWTHRTADHPAGLLIQSPGALAGVIQRGISWSKPKAEP